MNRDQKDTMLISESGPGPGDDVPCEKCGAIALDTGLECSECGHDNWEAVTGEPYEANPGWSDPLEAQS